MRLFIGIPMAAATVEELLKISTQLKSGAGGLRWTAPESWHITLQFLGETSPEKAASIVTQLRQIHHAPVVIGVQGMGFFDRAGIFYAGIHVSPELSHLQRRVEEATGRCGIVAEKRAFHPHITLARSGRERCINGLDLLKTKVRKLSLYSKFTAAEFLLYESFLGAGGARYEARERFSLSVVAD
jgi:RNA 2',3'-cyclic 3'-phosphodiesterase